MTTTSIVRRVRFDVLKKHPVLCFSAHLLKCARCRRYVHILLDNREIDRETVTTRWHSYHIPLPKQDMGRLAGDEVKLELLKTPGAASAAHAWEVKEVYFAAAR